MPESDCVEQNLPWNQLDEIDNGLKKKCSVATLHTVQWNMSLLHTVWNICIRGYVSNNILTRMWPIPNTSRPALYPKFSNCFSYFTDRKKLNTVIKIPWYCRIISSRRVFPYDIENCVAAFFIKSVIAVWPTENPSSYHDVVSPFSILQCIDYHHSCLLV